MPYYYTSRTKIVLRYTLNERAGGEYPDNADACALRRHDDAHGHAACHCSTGNREDVGGVGREYADDCTPSAHAHVRAHDAPSGAARRPSPSGPTPARMAKSSILVKCMIRNPGQGIGAPI